MGELQLRFRCHSCGHCCTDVVCMPTPYDVIRIVRETKADPYVFLEFLSPEEVSGVEDDDPTWLDAGGERYIMTLRRGKKGCHFLRKNRLTCKIYEHRPLLCRLYPFRVLETRKGKYKGFTLHKGVGCPKHRDGDADTKPLYDYYMEDDKHQEDYQALVEVFNRNQHEGKEPEDFITLFITLIGQKERKKGKRKKKK